MRGRGWLAIALVVASPAWARPRVVVVQSDDLGPYVDPVPAFLESLGEPAAVVNLHGRESDGRSLVERLRDDPPRVVFCLGAKAAWTVRQGLPDVPIVYTAVLDPDRYGIPGPLATGIASTADPVVYLSQYAGFFPDTRRIGILRGPGVDESQLGELQAAASEVGVELVVRDVSSPRQVRRTFEGMAEDIDALWLQPDRDVLTAETFRMLTDETRRRHLPLLVDTDNMVEAGGLFAVVPDAGGVGRQAAGIVRDILDDRPPTDAEVWPETVLVALNLRTQALAEVPFDPLLLDFVDIVVE